MKEVLMLHGIRVVASPLVKDAPRYTFDPLHKVPLTEEARARHEAWAKEFFKPRSVALVVNDSLFPSETMVVSPAMFEKLKRQDL